MKQIDYLSYDIQLNSQIIIKNKLLDDGKIIYSIANGEFVDLLNSLECIAYKHSFNELRKFNDLPKWLKLKFDRELRLHGFNDLNKFYKAVMEEKKADTAIVAKRMIEVKNILF